MKILDGSQLAGFIKERQAKQVRSISHVKIPNLSIVVGIEDPTINKYIELKKAYASDIGISVDVYKETSQTIEDRIKKLNDDEQVDGIIVQLPLPSELDQNTVLNFVDTNKDVDGLSTHSKFDPATPTAINWLLSGFNVDLASKKIAIVGQGALVGAPLTKLFNDSGYDVATVNRKTQNMKEILLESDVVISGVGVPGLIKSDMLAEKAVVVDAGTAAESGTIKGDLDEAVLSREDITVTPKRGGVGPLTVCALFENVIKAASLKG